MCDLAPFAVVGSNTIIQVDDIDCHEYDEADYDGNADQYLSPQIETYFRELNVSGWQWQKSAGP